MFVNFFIDRPIFASVLAIVIVVAGAVAIPFLPIAQFPEITPPQVVVTATYPGASAEVVEQTVATPIEQQVNGVEDMIYMSSRSGSDGTMTLTVTFKVGADLDIAAVNVQNRVSIAQAKLPADVTRQGITITKQSPDLVEIVALVSPDGSRDELYLANYATLQVVDVLARVPGLSPHYRIVVTREQTLDAIEVQAEVGVAIFREIGAQVFSEEIIQADHRLSDLRREIARLLHENIGVSMQVTLLPPGAAPRSEGGKLNRVVDSRRT